MGAFKNEGDPALALAEECAEVIQVITKMKRFNGQWDEIPPGKEFTRLTRWAMLEAEMKDLEYQWQRLKKQHVLDAAVEGVIREWEEEQDGKYNKDMMTDDAVWLGIGE